MILEDEATDIIQKAARGLGIPIPPHRTEDELRAAAQTLHLNANALLAIAADTYHPGVSSPACLKVVTTPFKGFTVNAYRIGNVCFDTGTDASALISGTPPEALFITHHHPQLHLDHIADLKPFLGTPITAPTERPLETTFTIGDLSIEALPTPGHFFHDTSYVITVPEFPSKIAIIGDLLFAGSIGAPNHSYPKILENARTHILSLPDDTLLCPGHGPLTTVSLEKAHNPFFAVEAA